MLNSHYLPAMPVPAQPPGLRVGALHVRGARCQDWPWLRSFLRSAGLSITGLAEHFDTVLVLERTGAAGVHGEILGCVAVERGHPALIRSLAVALEEVADGAERVLLAAALKVAAENGAREAILLVESTAQLPAYHLGLLLWDHLRARCPRSALVRELSNFESTALAVRLPVPRGAGSCASA